MSCRQVLPFHYRSCARCDRDWQCWGCLRIYHHYERTCFVCSKEFQELEKRRREQSRSRSPPPRHEHETLRLLGLPRQYLRTGHVMVPWCVRPVYPTDLAMSIIGSQCPLCVANVGMVIGTSVPSDRSFDISSPLSSCAREGTSAGFDSEGT